MWGGREKGKIREEEWVGESVLKPYLFLNEFVKGEEREEDFELNWKRKNGVSREKEVCVCMCVDKIANSEML